MIFIQDSTKDDISTLSQLFEILFQIPDDIVQIKRTVSDIIDATSSILSNNTDLLIKCFQYLIKGLDNKLLISI